MQAEEEELERQAEAAGEMLEDWELDEDQAEVLKEIQKTKKLMKNEAEMRKSKHKIVIPRTKRDPKTLGQFEDHLTGLGIDPTKVWHIQSIYSTTL